MTLFGNDYSSVLFEEKDKKIFIRELRFFGKEYLADGIMLPHSNVFLVGESYVGKMFGRYGKGGEELLFGGIKEEKSEKKHVLYVTEYNDAISVLTVYEQYYNSAVILCRKEITNSGDTPITLECANIFTIKNPLVSKRTENGILKEELPVLIKARNSWCHEAVFEQYDLRRGGLRGLEKTKRCGKISVVGNGSQTTHTYLPMGILKRGDEGAFMFELSPSGSWSYEIEGGLSDSDDSDITLAITGRNLYDNGWYAVIEPREKYVTDEVKFCGGRDTERLAMEFTFFRRLHNRKASVSPCEYVVYNNFQQNTYDHPTAESDVTYIQCAKECGADYYVVDAGWHDETTEGKSPTVRIGEWEENRGSYPDGFSVTVESARKSGLKFGLWTELQSVGYYCKNKNLLDEDCYFHINGIRSVASRRYQLNYDNGKVRDYADAVIAKIVRKYNPDYIKIDYNQTQYGNDCNRGSLTEGLSRHIRAYNEWFYKIQEKYPEIIFESCASGGMAADAAKAEITSVFSTTDAGLYTNYPYIVANIFMSTLPEQNGIWCMPVQRIGYPDMKEKSDLSSTDEETVMNVINSLYGVMHLSSRLGYLTKEQKKLLLEGIKYYKQLAAVKKKLVPVFPNGFACTDDEIVYVALRGASTLYLSVFNLSDADRKTEIDLARYGVKSVRLAYPAGAGNKYGLENSFFRCTLKPKSARSFEFGTREDAELKRRTEDMNYNY